MEHIKEWHRLNPGQIVTSRLSSNANPDPKQAAMQQLLIHKVMQQDIAIGRVLSKEEWIEAFDTSATSSSSNLTPAPAAKPADNGKASEHTVANEQPPVTKEPVAQPPIHPFSGIPGHYVPPTNRNFAAPDRTNNGAYQTMPPIHNIEQSKAVFKWVLSTKVTVLVGELCSVSQDIRNQFRTVVMPKQLKQKHPVAFIAKGMDEEDNTTPTYVNIPFPTQFVANKPPKQRGVQVKKKYKPVAMKTKPVASHVSKDFQIECQIISNLLATIPQLNPNPPPFVPTKQFTSEQQVKLVKDHDTGFLTTDKINVLVNMVAKQEKAFAWEDSKQGSLCPDFFPPVCIPTIPHVPWVQHNCPIPPGLEKEVCEIIHDKISTGVYKPSNSAYHSRWFCVLKKNGKLRIVHSLEPLNHVTICHSGVSPFPDHIAESFTGCISLWEFFELLNRVLQQMKYCGGTLSGHKLVLCTPTFKILVLILPTVATPAPLFSKIYMDTMFMPPSNKFKYIIQGCCLLTHYPEFCMLTRENTEAIAKWLYEDIICRWGALSKIVTDNGPPILKVVTYLVKKYNLHHIWISGYNKCANGIVKWPHFNVHQALFKAVDGDQSRWSTATYLVFWSERVMVHKQMGCSPYFATTSTHSLLPANIVEVTYLQPPPNSLLLTTDLIACRAIDLQHRQEDLDCLHSHVLSACCLAAICFNYNFKAGNLVLMRNTRIEVMYNKKMKPCYPGPLVVISHNCGGTYIICELDGSVLHRPIAAFCLVPYFAREHQCF
ncbi:hypothetical protein J132_08835 [Termitomyces sp. J132]|nr:hypothetical protein J132_08835 [Termitomyces sp. J132]